MLVKNFTPAGEIPEHLLKQGSSSIRQASGDFDRSKGIDRDNEHRPKTEQPPDSPNQRLHNLRQSQDDLIRMLRVSYDDILAETRKRPLRRPSIEVQEKVNPLAKSSKW
jgi:hypothetical protein